MAFVIKQRQVVADSWQLLKAADDLVPWCRRRAMSSCRSRFGSISASPVVARRTAGRMAGQPTRSRRLIARSRAFRAWSRSIFRSFGDGRGYSIARLLRERYGYKGELRAIGEVVRDHLFFMARCGFDSFLLRDDQKPRKRLPRSATSATPTRQPPRSRSRCSAAAWARMRRAHEN